MDSPSYGFSWPRLTRAVKLLLIANCAVFVVNAILQGALGSWLGVSWDGLWEGFGLGLVRLITYQFVHDFYDPMHVLLNMLMLYFFGTFVEEAVGEQRLMRLYLAAGVAGALLQMVMTAIMQGSSSVPTVGASGAVYGILVYAACMAPRMRVILLIFPVELRILAGILVGIGVYMMYVELALGRASGIAHGVHVGGAAFGFFAHRTRWQGFALMDRVQSWRQQRNQQTEADRRAKLDELLEKVHQHGITSLTAAERRFLDRASQEMRRK
ncbi:MAG: rhomboid family intramembrane serine protease [Planctomycetota bacterium]